MRKVYHLYVLKHLASEMLRVTRFPTRFASYARNTHTATMTRSPELNVCRRPPTRQRDGREEGGKTQRMPHRQQASLWQPRSCALNASTMSPQRGGWFDLETRDMGGGQTEGEGSVFLEGRLAFFGRFGLLLPT